MKSVAYSKIAWKIPLISHFDKPSTIICAYWMPVNVLEHSIALFTCRYSSPFFFVLRRHECNPALFPALWYTFTKFSFGHRVDRNQFFAQFSFPFRMNLQQYHIYVDLHMYVYIAFVSSFLDFDWFNHRSQCNCADVYPWAMEHATKRNQQLQINLWKSTHLNAVSVNEEVFHFHLIIQSTLFTDVPASQGNSSIVVR